jgi:MFS transporter, DHA2 family, methylenomycin A resistance protein
VLALFAVGVVGAGLFILVEHRGRSPMVPLDLFTSRSFSAAAAIGALINLAYYGEIFVLSLYFQEVRGYSPFATGLAFLPLTGATFLLAAWGGRLSARFGPALPMAAGVGVGAAGFLALLVAGADTPYVALVPGLALLSLGAMVPAPLSVAMVSSAPNRQSGVVSGILNAWRQMGTAFGVAVFGSLVASGDFIDGMHATLWLAAGGFTVSLILTLGFLRVRPGPRIAAAPGATE